MSSLVAKLSKCRHPNSRRTKALSKKVKRLNNKYKNRSNHLLKSNVLGEKLSWFADRIEDREEPLSAEEFAELIADYLKRFDEELEQIHLKQSISKNRTNQHAARESVIKMTLEKENLDYATGGIELMNLCEKEKLQTLKRWNRTAINVQHLKLDLISKNLLEMLKTTNKMEES